MSDSIESRLKEDRRFQPSDDFKKRAHVTSHAEYTSLYQKSLDEPDEFWRTQTCDLVFRTPWTKNFASGSDHSWNFVHGVRKTRSHVCVRQNSSGSSSDFW